MLIPTILWASEPDALVSVELMRAGAPLPSAKHKFRTPKCALRAVRTKWARLKISDTSSRGSRYPSSRRLFLRIK